MSLPKHASTALAFLLALLLVGWTVHLRAPVIEGRPLAGLVVGEGYADAENATGHMLATSLAMRQVPASTHRFLPIATMRPEDAGIDNYPGSAAPDRNGYLYYASWPPLAFAIPHLVDRLLGEPPSVQRLRWMSLGTGLLASLLLALVVREALRGVPGTAARLAPVVAALAYACSIEGLRGHSITWWTAHPQQLLILLQALLVLRGRPLLALPLVFLGCLLDWSAYPAALGMGLLLAWMGWRGGNPALVRAGVLTLGAAAAGGLALLAWYASQVGLGEYLAVLLRRSEVNANAGILELFPAYAEALGGLALPANLAFWFCVWLAYKRRLSGPECAALLLLAFPVAENLVMPAHASYYTYDLLKGVAFLSLVLALAVARSGRWAWPALGLVAALGAANAGEYRERFADPAAWSSPRLAWNARAGALVRETAGADDLALFSYHVRGELMFAAGRNMFERVQARAALTGLGDVEEAARIAALLGRPRAIYYRLSPDMRVLEAFDVGGGRTDFLWRRDMFAPPP